ncbi:hypothetical protein HPB50_020463 [Hyalomma asiaticum]|uniref:Uncharacterized protein n=1 Tax=Hyalomma asiaticum TaxID=266040 RepID=A0ACB7T3N0_HYAAI|nr:hypothetical protein HPB50_020463 [Hyalomma asiaticum]
MSRPDRPVKLVALGPLCMIKAQATCPSMARRCALRMVNLCSILQLQSYRQLTSKEVYHLQHRLAFTYIGAHLRTLRRTHTDLLARLTRTEKSGRPASKPAIRSLPGRRRREPVEAASSPPPEGTAMQPPATVL